MEFTIDKLAYDKAIERLAKLDGDYVEMFRRIKRHNWK